MDNATHTLVGLALARAGLGRFAPRATLVLLLSANAPDIDVVSAGSGALSYLEHHRGYTHSVVAAPIMAAACVFLCALFARTRQVRWSRLFLLALIGIASHLFLDWTNSYGIRLLLPFSFAWFAGDINSLTDLVLLAVLLWAAVWPWFAGLVSREIGDRPGSGRTVAVVALLFFACYDMGRASLHARVVDGLNARLYQDAVPVRVAALPVSLNPLHWTGIVETERSYITLPVNAFENIDPAAARALYKITPDSATEAARRTEPFRFLQYFARFPVWSEGLLTSPSGAALRRVDLTDLRFGSPGGGSFHAIAFVDERGRVLSSTFTFGPGPSLPPS